MRCDQHMGLPPEAIAFLEKHEQKPPVCACCIRSFAKVLIPIDVYVGMFGSEYQLFRHPLKDGRYADEFLQAAIPSSGPCFFLGLKVTDDAIFEWSQEDLDSA